MRHPKNPFSPDEPADAAELTDGTAYDWLGDRDEVAAEGMPRAAARRSGGPPLPRRTADSGFRPSAAQAPGQDFWPLTDPEGSWPLAPRPQAEPLDSRPAPQEPWAQGAPQDAWTHSQDGWTQAGTQDPWLEGGRQERGQDGPQEAWGQAGPQDPWADDGRQEPLAQAGPQEPLAQAGPEEAWAQAGPEGSRAPAGPEGSRAPAEAPHSWSPAPPSSYDGSRDYWDDADLQEPWPSSSPQQAGSQEPWLQAAAADAPSAPSVPDVQEAPPRAHTAGPPDMDEPWLRTPEPKTRGRRRRGKPAAPEPASQDAGPAPSLESPDLWESWEPPYSPAAAAAEPLLNHTAPYPELVRDAEYEDDLWEAPGLGGAGGDGPRYPGPRRRAAHARNAGRPRLGGAFLALAGALAIAGAIPLGMLGVRALHHGNPALKTAPLSASRAADSGQNGAATFTALAGPGCPAAANAAAIPYHAPDGDGWHPGTASASGPCGNSFTYSYLAMVPGNPGEWHDHYTWIFRTGMNNPSCTFSLYIPAAAPANSTDYYWFSAGDSNPDHRIADFTIDQAAHQGQWITKGPFTFPGGTVLIEATDRGGEGSPMASVTAGAARLNC